MELTEKPREGNRASRKAFERERLSGVGTPAKTIKLADLIDNSASITEYDPSFAKVYMKEKKDLLEVLGRGDKSLYKKASEIIEKLKKCSETFNIQAYKDLIRETHKKQSLLGRFLKW